MSLGEGDRAEGREWAAWKFGEYFGSDLDLFTVGIFYYYWIEKFERCRAQGLFIIS